MTDGVWLSEERDSDIGNFLTQMVKMVNLRSVFCPTVELQ